jgi:hypothetical protein
MSDRPRVKTPETAAEVIDLLLDAGAMTELGITANHARTMKARNSIPGDRDCDIVAAAVRHRLPIDYALLARLRAERKPLALGARQS